ncbi:MAG TPA: ATP-binding protein [Chloroflexota bacterium]|nr:ATP-binding protein [Chloroflexota bacterium]
MTVESPGLSDGLLDLDAPQALSLYRVGRLVAASQDLDATLQAITESTHALIGAATTRLALIEDDGRLILRAAQGSADARLGEPLEVDHGVSAMALRERHAILLADMTALVPLIWEGEPLGVLVLALAGPNRLAPGHVALVEALAELAAAAVRHARDTAEEIRLREESQEILRQFSEQEAQLERVQEQLIQNEKLTAIGQLVQGLAHEMNTPLSVVITNLSVLGRHANNLFAVAVAARDVLPQLLADPQGAALAGPLVTAVRGADLEYTMEDLPELLTDSTAAVQRVAELVRSMANFARRDTGGPSPVAVEGILEAALTLASNPLKRCAKIVREFAEIPPVLGLASELTELFLHLLINAAQALELQPGTVTLTTTCADGCVEVRIHDTGRGISAEQLPRVFDPFFTTRPVGGGTGMGLAVCYGIVARHSGSIAIESQPGSGATVTVRLPAAE